MFYSINVRNAIVSGAINALKVYNFGEAEPLNTSHWTKHREKSQFGKPLFAPLEIKDVTFTNEQGREETIPGMFIDCVLTTVQQTKNIVRTEITGRNGSIKEYISDGDFQVSFKIVLYERTNEFPEEAVSRFVELLRANVPLSVTSPVLNAYGIDNIVVTSYSNPQRQGFENLAIFDVECLSDIPLELQVNEI